MKQALSGLRVLDFTTGMAGPLATMILSDFGAEVIRVEPRGGDPLWSHPAYLLWNRGKKSISIDLETSMGMEHAKALIADSDVLVESMGPGAANQLGIGYSDTVELNGTLVYFSISAFGKSGPYKHYKAYDGIVNAKTGRMRDQVGHQVMRPTYRAVNDTSYHTAMFTVQGILAALRVAWETGRGQYADTSLLKGTTAPNNPWLYFKGSDNDLPPDRYPAELDRGNILLGELALDRREQDPYSAIPSQLCTPCKDDRWIMHAHPQLKLFRSWIKTIGFDWIWDDDRYSGAPTSFPSDADRVQLNLMIFERMREKAAHEWIELYRENPDCAGEIMQSTHEAMHHPEFAKNHTIEIDDPRVGRMTQVGPLVAMSETPATITRPAPVPGQHTREILTRERPARNSIYQGGRALGRPLDGIVVIELATWLATPFAGALLADFGAGVIKVESLVGDPMRGKFTNEDNGVRVTQGKQSLALNLQAREGQAILHKLVAKADVLVHNFRPGVPRRLGLDYEQIRPMNPDLVYVCASSYGSTGGFSRRAAFNPTAGAFSGNSVFQSGEGNTPIGDQAPDPIAGSAVATAIMLGLAARWRLGVGQYLETTMMKSCVYCNSDDAFDYAGKAPRHNPDKDQLGLEATYRLYETKEGWVFLAVHEDDDFAAFCSIAQLDKLAVDPRFVTASQRYANRTALGELLAPTFKGFTAEQWESRLAPRGLGCVRADGLGYRRFAHLDPHAQKTDFMVPTRHQSFARRGGEYRRHGPVVDFSRTPCQPGLPYAVLGEHTEAILEELGFSGAAIERLAKENVIGLSSLY